MMKDQIMKLKITSIEWDFDGEDENEVQDAVDCVLPSVPFYIDVDEEGFDPDALPVADAISDEYGYCVKDCTYEEV